MTTWNCLGCQQAGGGGRSMRDTAQAHANETGHVVLLRYEELLTRSEEVTSDSQG